jgi:CubicO group peptidase (beta-lactamase class C family)
MEDPPIIFRFLVVICNYPEKQSMTKNPLIIPVLLLLLASCQQNEPSDHNALSQDLDSLLQSIPDFSGVLLIAENGNPVYHQAFGYRTFSDHTPLEITDIFELASVSKQFTAMIIMMLKEEDKLQYDDPLEKYIPGLPYPGITIRHLLNHTSGLPDYQAVMDQYWDKSKVAGNEECIEYLIKYHPKENFAPGEKYEYSNTGYMLLATIAEKASGKDFIGLCRERIFTPVAMAQTDIRTKEDKLKLQNMAWGHLYVAEKQAYIPADSFPAFNYSIWLGNRKGPGRISSSASDLLKWDQALYKQSLVREGTLHEAFTPATLNSGSRSSYGFGWVVEQHAQLGKKVSHAGDNPGYKTMIIRYIDERRTLILLSNNAHAKFDAVVDQVEMEIASNL